MASAPDVDGVDAGSSYGRRTDTAHQGRGGEDVSDHVLPSTGGSMPQTEEGQAQVMRAGDAWYKEIGGAIKDGGNPFTQVARTVASDGSAGDVAGGEGGS